MKTVRLREIPYKKRRLFAALAVAVLVTALAASGLLYYPDNYLTDALYQTPQGPDERILVVGIDAYALEQLGPWPWDRAVMADILETLNGDPEARPAVIGLDVLYGGRTNEESDARLVEAASAGNVILAAAALFDAELVVEEGGEAAFDDFAVSQADLPFPALAGAADYGHTNAMYDLDGILRHHLWSVPLPDGGQLESFPHKIYEKFCAHAGLPADFQPARTDRGYWLVEFAGAPGDYYACSAADILEGGYDPDLFADAIVLVGPYTLGLTDQYVTAADRTVNMYGVEYVANVLDAMLRGAEKDQVSDLNQLVGLFALTGLLAVLGVFLPLRAGILLHLAAAGASLGVSLLAWKAGTVLHPLWLPLGCGLSFVVTVGAHYLVEALERRRVVKTFERYQDPTVIKELLRHGITDADLRGKTVELAVLFVDIRGFTTMSEQLAPEQVVEVLDKYLTLTSAAVKQHGGTLDKFVGDCTMAFWGAPLPCEDKAYKACQAAVYMTRRAEELSEQLYRQFGHKVSFGVGVHLGPATVGNIGAPDRKDYTAIGDTVNTASRLESNAPRGTIYISRAVADALGHRAAVTSLGDSVKLKGKTEGFEVLTLDALYDQNHPNKEEPQAGAAAQML